MDQVEQTQLGDLADFRERGLDLLFARILQPQRKRFQNSLLLVPPCADDEREAEFFPIAPVEISENDSISSIER